jgi:hypothetical protein
MSFERPGVTPGSGPEPAPTPPTEPPAEPGTGGTPLALQLQVLSTEHWSLLASRSLAWNESFARAGMFLSALSGAIVALALVAQASSFGDAFRIFALVILPVVLFIGVTTLLRLGIANYHDGICVLGMNRIRGAYVERVPEVERYFVMSPHDDEASVWSSMGMDPSYPIGVTLLASAPTLISVLNAVLAGAILGIAAIQLGSATGPAWIAAITGFVLAFGLQVWFGRREALRPRPDVFTPMNPAPREGPDRRDRRPT